MIHALSLSWQLTPDLDKPFINRHLSPYIHLLAPGVQHMGASYLLSVDTKPKSFYFRTDSMDKSIKMPFLYIMVVVILHITNIA